MERDLEKDNIEKHVNLFIDVYKTEIDKTTRKFRRTILGFKSHNGKLKNDYNIYSNIIN